MYYRKHDYAGKSAREIAKEIDVSPTTITREVKRNKIVKIPSICKSNVSIYCLNFHKCCHKGDLCENCISPYTLCQRCKIRKCTALCKDFKIRMCPETLKWPYICDSSCTKETHAECQNAHIMALKQITDTGKS